MDIEGAEVEVLFDLIESGAIDCCDMVLVETHEASIPALREPTARLRVLIKERKIRHVDLDWI